MEKLTVREAARRCQPLSGVDAQGLEGALAQTERELAAAKLQVGRLRDMLNDVRGLVYQNHPDALALVLRRIEDGSSESRTGEGGGER